MNPSNSLNAFVFLNLELNNEVENDEIYYS
jgi:hypothetical protein